MFKILVLAVLCFAKYGAAMRLFSQESNNNQQCICTDGTKFKTFPFNQNEDKFNFINSLFPKDNNNPLVSFFEALNAPDSKGSLVENFIEQFENILQPSGNQNELTLLINKLLPSTKYEEPKNLLSSLFAVPKLEIKLPEIKFQQDPENINIPQACSTIWPYVTQMFDLVPKEPKSPINLDINEAPVTTLPNNNVDKAPNANINSVAPVNKNIYAQTNTNNHPNNLNPYKIGAFNNPQSSLSPGANVNFAPPNTGLNLINGQANPSNFNAGFKVPNFNLGGMYNNIGGAFTSPFNINGGLQLPNVNLGGGLNMDSNLKYPYLGSNINIPGVGLGFGLNPYMNMGQGYPGVNLGGALNSGLNLNGGIGLNGGFNQNGGVNYGENGINWLSNFPKNDGTVVARSNLDGYTATGGKVAGVTPAPAAAYPATTAAPSPAPNADYGVQYAKTPDATANVNVNTDSQASQTTQLQGTAPLVLT